MLQIFLSYHHRARKTAGELKRRLGLFGVDVFLAHDDLEPSAEWQKEILRQLRRCDVFIPLLTRSYHSSFWTDQETGIAVASRKHILPLKFRDDPYGFIGKFQALKVGDDLGETCWKIVRHLVSVQAFEKALKDGVIEALVSSRSFEESAQLSHYLLKLAPYSKPQLHRLVEGAARNQQIYGGWRARDAVRKLIAAGDLRVRPALVRSFERRVESWG